MELLLFDQEADNLENKNMESSTNRPRIFVIPPVIYLICVFAGITAELLFPTEIHFIVSARIAGVVIFFIGFGIAYWSVKGMKKANTNVSPLKATTHLVTSGTFKFCRNPIYLGLAITIIGTAFVASNLWLFALLIVYIFWIHFGVIKPEENFLEQAFGDEYLSYKTQIGRWF